MKIAKKIVWKLLNTLSIGGPLQMLYKSYLTDVGWYKSYSLKQSIDKDGKPLPWCTYPYIHFIETRLHKELTLLEFGSGNSTLWYAERIKSIFAIENDKTWYDKISKTMPSNVTIIHQPLDEKGSYYKISNTLNKKFDLIIIDGRERVNSIKHSIDSLAENGVMILDNSERESYKEGILFLQNKGFKNIDFIGLSPITAQKNSTTIFYKGNNCLNI